MRLRDYDPETWTEQRDEHRADEDLSDRRGMRGERDLEALVHGEDYRDRYDTEQARKARDAANIVGPAPTASAGFAEWSAMNPEPDAEHVAIDSFFRPITVLRNQCGCTWNAESGCRASTCDVHLKLLVAAL